MERGDFSLSESYSHVFLVLRGPELPPPEGRDIVVNPEMECFCEKFPEANVWELAHKKYFIGATSYGPGKMSDR